MLELMVVVGVAGIVGAITLPATSRTLSGLRLRGDAHNVTNLVSLAKMRAAAEFTRTRVFVALDTNTFWVQSWNKTTNAWTTEGGVMSTSQGVGFGFGILASPPPNTQATLAQAPACRDNAGNTIAGSACIVFNSRGIPVDSAGAPTGNDALYVTDGTAVYATTLTATPLVRLWSSPAGTAGWIKQ